MNNLIVTDKMLDCIQFALRPSTYCMFFEGSIRSIKTTTVIQMFHFLVQTSDKTYHLISANDNNSIKDVILEAEMGLITLYPDLYEMKKDEIGGYYVAVKSLLADKPQNKKILLCGFSNKSRWKAINGHEFGVILLDEANNANKQFIDECFARQANVDDPKMLMTMNGDNPTHYIYTDYVNNAKILGKAPASIVAEMNEYEKKQGYYYVHFTMHDNPTMTPEKIARTESIYPKGSYYYTIKILGERGTTGALIFNDYMNKDRHIKNVDKEIFYERIVGVDIGASRARNAFTLVGFKKDYSLVAPLDKHSFKQVGYDSKRKQLVDKVLEWQKKYGYIRCISVDSAEQNFIFDLKQEFKKYNIEVISSYKATIKERIDLIIVLLVLNRLVFNDNANCRELFEAYLNAKWDKDKIGEVREDNNDPINDDMDSFEYALTVHMKGLLLATKKAINGN